MSEETDVLQQRIALALRQRLESLGRFGVQQMGRPPAPTAPAVTAAAATTPAAATAAPTTKRRHTAAEQTPPPTPTRQPEPPGELETPAPTSVTTGPTNLTAADPADKAAALAAMSTEVAQCRRCAELANCRTQTVFGVGNPHARLCFFGEAPGADEDLQGEPFVGRAGQLLDKIIAACTLRREDVYIMNVLKCRPPGNRNPQPDEIANCRSYFERQFELIQPEFICCLGAIAAQSLLRTTQYVGRLRGRIHDYRGAKVVVTYHPSYLLRNPDMKRATWEDMKLLMNEMGIEIPKPGRS